MADIDVAQAKIRVAQSQIAQAETMVSYMDLTAPFDGYVTDRKVAAGHYVQPAGASESQPLIKIANLSRIRVFVNIPESEAAWVDANFGSSLAGDPVTILSPALPNGKIESRVTRTNLQLDPQSRSLTVEIDLDNNDLKILPGTFVTTKLLLEQRENVLTLPVAALIKTNEGTKCCMVTEGKIQHRPIELGLRVGDEVEIRLGLDGSETLVMARAAALQAGQEVEVLKKK